MLHMCGVCVTSYAQNVHIIFNLLKLKETFKMYKCPVAVLCCEGPEGSV